MYTINSIKNTDTSKFKNHFITQAFRNEDSKGRKYPLNPPDMFGEYNDPTIIPGQPFLTDYLRIHFSDALKRIQYKTQVFNTVYDERVTDRASHTMDICNNSLSVSEFLGLNKYLCLSISIGHDVGHTPLGHYLERFLNNILKKSGKKFSHEINGLTITQYVENNGNGLNLCFETLEGILNHSRNKEELILNNKLIQEYNLVMYLDKIMYTSRDVDDAFNKNIIKEDDIEFNDLMSNARLLIDNFGSIHEACIKSLIIESCTKGFISFSEGEVFNAFNTIRDEMYKKVYPRVDISIHSKEFLEDNLNKIYDALDKASIQELKTLNANIVNPVSKPQPALLISLLTDNELMELINDSGRNELTLNKIISKTSIKENMTYIMQKEFDPFKPNLEWASH